MKLLASSGPCGVGGGRPGGAPGTDEAGEYGYWTLSVRQAVRCALEGQWDVPAFQRRYVWKPWQVCDLADSLWRGYPIGFFLLWHDRREAGTKRHPLWIADGHQRLTSLCLLFGQPPRWWRSRDDREGAQLMRRYAVYFDLEASHPPFFRVAPRGCEGSHAHLVAVPRLLALELGNEPDRAEFQRIIDAAASRRCPAPDRNELERRLRRVLAIGERAVLATVFAHRRTDEVLEVFQRLNSSGRFRRLLLKLLMQRMSGLEATSPAEMGCERPSADP